MTLVVTFGEIMLRLVPPGNLRITQTHSFEAIFGGGEANVAVSLTNLGVHTSFISRIPKNTIGDACINYLRQYGVDTCYIIRGGDRLGIYFMEMGSSIRPSNVIYDRDGSSFATIEPGMIDWRQILQGAGWFHWTGITPAVSSGAAGVCLEGLKVAKEYGITVSGDLNYRAKLWKWGRSAGEVIQELVALSDVIVANEEDAEKVFGIRALDVDITSGKLSAEHYTYVCTRLHDSFPNLKLIAITLRGSLSASNNTWSAVIWKENRMYYGHTFEISPIVDRVGGGDSFVAGLIYSLLKDQNNVQKALDFSLAASALKHTIYGDFNLVTVDEIEKVLTGDISGRVSR